ncbi:MAG TPA: hypothetical protein VGC87_19300 [Pyrinomonadaceae bacterium]|jgi:hypothetical protein
MGKPAKVLLGVATVAPFVLTFLMMVVFFSTASSVFSSARSRGVMNEDAFSSVFGAIFTLQILLWLLTVGLTIFYIVNVFRNDRVVKDKKALWAVVIFMGSVFAMPVYWYLYIWREPEAAVTGWGGRGYLNDAGTGQRAGDYGAPPPPPPDWR